MATKPAHDSVETAHEHMHGMPSIMFASLDPDTHGSNFRPDLVAADPTHVSVAGSPPLELERVYSEPLPSTVAMFEDMFGHTPEDDPVPRPVPLRAAVDDAVSVCVLVMGSHRSRKRRLFNGDENMPNKSEAPDGVIGWAATKLFNLLRDKSSAMAAAGHFYEYSMRLSFVEFHDESMTDLLRPSNQDLDIKFGPRHGYGLVNAEQKLAKNAGDAISALQYARQSRNVQQYNVGNAVESSSAVFQFELEQKEGDGPSPHGAHSVVSRILIAECPSTHRLTIPDEELQLRHGPTLNKSLLALREVVKSLSAPDTVLLTPYASSNLTQLLADALGGDALVVGLAALLQGDTAVNVPTMKVLSMLTKATHYPVSKNKTLANGLLIKYRAAVLQVLDRLEESKLVNYQNFGDKGGSGKGGEGDEILVQRLKNLERELMDAQLERNVAREDGMKVYKMLELFKAKYMRVVEEKSGRDEALIESEQQKLAVARALLDLRLEYSQIQEQFENDKYDLTSELLTAKNELCDAEIKIKDLAGNGRDATEMREQLKRLSGEHGQLKTKAMDQDSRSEEVGLQLLLLQNENDVLKEEQTKNKGVVADAKARVVEAERSVAELRAKEREIDEQYLEARETSEKMRADKLKSDLELQRALVGFEQKRLDADKSSQEIMRERDTEVYQIRRSGQEEIKALRAEKEEQAATLSQLEVDRRKEARRARDLELLIQRQTDELEGARGEKATAVAEFKRVQGQHHEKIMGILLDEANAQNQPNKSEDAQKALMEDLINTYREREEKLEGEVEELRGQYRALVRKNQQLFDSYTVLRDLLEDNAPSAVPPPAVSERAENALGQSEEMEHANQQLVTLQAQLRESQREVSAQAEKNVQVAETYRQVIKSLEAQTGASGQNAGSLASENDRLRAELDMHRGAATTMKLASEPHHSSSARSGGGLKTAERTELADLRHEVATLRRKGAVNSRVDSTQLESLRAENSRLKRDLSEGNRASTPGVLAQLKAAEGRAASVGTQKVMIEEELRSYRQYMKMTVQRYRDQIQSLQDRLNERQ